MVFREVDYGMWIMEWLKMIHISSVMLSFALFVLRGYWMCRSVPYLQQKIWARYVPDSIDTVLMVSGISMMFQFSLFPHQQPWLAAKLLALLLYIVLGSVALHRTKNRHIRLGCYVVALMVFVYMVAVALNKQVLPLSM